ncbi:MAG: serine hydrolase [Pseudomonadales bacterium]|nr:serine hydrolase [Pseudomonadales bacterium]
MTQQSVYLCKFIILAMVMLSYPGTRAAEPRVTDHPEVQGALAVIDAWAEGVVAYDDVPGVSIGVVLDQDLIFSKGYGFSNVRRKVAADSNTIYSICSISKLFTSIAVMRMRDQGKLALRDPVADHLPWFNIKEQHAEAGPTRIEGLLTHSSGLPRESDFAYWQDDYPFPDREAMMARLSEQDTLYPAESLFQYSNLGLTLAGEIAAMHSGKPYADHVQEAILDPLGLQDTRPFFPEDLHGKQMAIGYTGKFRDRKRQPVPPFDTKAIAPAAGFTSTVDDLAKFASWQFRTLAGEPNQVLDRNTLREMHRVHWVNPDWSVTWGLGFVVSELEGTSTVSHGGGCPGYITQFVLVPKHKLGVVVLTNASDGPAGKIGTNILKMLGPALGEAKKPSVEVASDLEEFVGNYGGLSWGGELAIRVWGDKLVVVDLPRDELKDLPKLKRIDGDLFRRVTKDGEEREPWVFERNDDGRVAGIRRHSIVMNRILWKMAEVTLTFDNGPTTDVTPVVLQELAARELNAYFCVVGRQLQRGQEHVDVVRETLAAGHVVVNHSLTHGVALGDDTSGEHAFQEIVEMDRVMGECLGDWGEKLFRPFGRGGSLGPHVFSQNALSELGALDYSVLLWNNVPRDWEEPVGWVKTALADIAGQSHSVVVLHDLNTGAMKELPRFLDTLLAEGHTFTCELPDECVPMRSGVAAWPEEQLADLVQADD